MENRVLTLNLSDDEMLENLGDAFSSPIRRKIINLLITGSFNLLELANILDISPSTLSFHIKILKDANLIKMVSAPNKKGNEKNVSLALENINIILGKSKSTSINSFFLDIPIGSFSNQNITPPCMMCSKDGYINPIDNPIVFDSAEKIKAQLISFISGFLEYKILTHPFYGKKIVDISFSVEICSECPMHNNTWKSDITFWINDVEIGSFRSNGDYGGRKGLNCPSWYPIESSNYGTLVKLSVNKEGSFICNNKISDFKIDNLDFSSSYISFKIGVKPTSRYVGGIVIFGKEFGDYSTDILFSVEYEN